MRRIIYSVSFILSLIVPILLGIFIEKSALILLLTTGIVSFLLFTFFNKENMQGIISVTLIIMIYLQLIMIPYSYYVTWFQISSSQIPSGVITTTLCQIITMVWIYYMTKLYPFKVMNLLFPVIIGLFFISFVVHSIYIYIVILVILLLNITIPVFISNKKRYSLQLLAVFFIVAGISSLIYDNFKSGGSRIVNNNSYEIRNWIEKYLPFVTILSSIPGVHGQYNTATGKPPVLTNNALFAVDGNPGDRFYIRFEVGNEEHITKEKIIIDNKLRSNTLEITVMADFLPVLPIMLNTVDSNLFEIGDKDKTHKLLRPLLKGNKLLLYQSKTEKSSDEIEVLLPNTNNTIQILAKTLKRDTQLLTAISIRNYLLAEDFFYSLDVKESENYIEDFLMNTKTGFCIHYTRAFKLLAELNGIPVREVSGYLVDIPIPDVESGYYRNISVATGYDAHLWPEIYIDGEWITFEVTKSIFRDESYKPEIKPFISTSQSVIETTKDRDINNYIFLLFIPLFILFSIIYYNLWHKQYLKRWIYRSQRNGIPHPKYTGWLIWCKKSGVETIVENIIINHFYNSYILTKEDKKRIKENYYLSRK